MKTLVVGGTHYMGRHLVRALLEAGHEVTIATRGQTADPFSDQVRRKILDHHDRDSVQAALAGEAYDTVVDTVVGASNDVRYLLDTVETKRYVMASTISVYAVFHLGMRAAEMDTAHQELRWCGVDDLPYGEAKAQAEAALFQAYPNVSSVAVRFPWIFGPDDYTQRLFFYVDHIVRGQPMNIDNYEANLTFINSQEAGQFLAHCAGNSLRGAVNVGSLGTVSIEQIDAYIGERTGRRAILSDNGDAAPLNGVPSFSVDMETALGSGFPFRRVEDWVFPLVDQWVGQAA